LLTKGLKTTLKRDKFDRVISDIVRVRANMTCQRCGIVDSEGQIKFKSNVMDCSHFYGRGNSLVCRYDIDLLSCLCKKCHNYVETRPLEHTQYMAKLVGEDFLEIKKEQHHKPTKMTKADKKDMYSYYCGLLKDLIEQRKNGNTFYIETVSYF